MRKFLGNPRAIKFFLEWERLKMKEQENPVLPTNYKYSRAELVKSTKNNGKSN
jgi:hypothetical protein